MKGIDSPLSTTADLTGSPELYSPLILHCLEILFQPKHRPRQEGGLGVTQRVQLGATLIMAMGFIVLYPLYFCLEGTLHRSFFLKYGFGDGPRGKIQTLKHNLI